MNAPLNIIAHQVMRIYEIYDRASRVVMGRVEVTVRADLLTAAPWAMDYVKDGTEATGSRTGVRFIGERIIRKAEKPATFTDKQFAQCIARQERKAIK